MYRVRSKSNAIKFPVAFLRSECDRTVWSRLRKRYASLRNRSQCCSSCGCSKTWVTVNHSASTGPGKKWNPRSSNVSHLVLCYTQKNFWGDYQNDSWVVHQSLPQAQRGKNEKIKSEDNAHFLFWQQKSGPLGVCFSRIES